MSETVTQGWIKDEAGNKFAPKTTTDQVQTGDGVKILDYIANLLRSLTKNDVGLSNVDNTSDLNKPISTATQKALNDKANSNHNHDDRYYTEPEVDDKLSSKSDTNHTHDDRYYTESEINSLVAKYELPIGTMLWFELTPDLKLPSYGTWEYVTQSLENGGYAIYKRTA